MQNTPSNPDAHNWQPAIGPVAPNEAMQAKQSPARKKRKTLAEHRMLRPGQAGIAWERLKRVVRDHCLHPSHERLSFHAYGPTIKFESAKGGPVVTLMREDNRILKRLEGSMRTIHIVGLKTKGVGFEYKKHCLTATRLMIEIVHELRENATDRDAQSSGKSGEGKKKPVKGSRKNSAPKTIQEGRE